MAASDHLQPRQLQMLMTGGELQNLLTDSNDRRFDFNKESMDDMWDRKLQESQSDEAYQHGAGVYDSLEHEGLRPNSDPFQVWHSMHRTSVSDGHHRIAAAAELERRGDRQIFFPVEHIKY